MYQARRKSTFSGIKQVRRLFLPALLFTQFSQAEEYKIGMEGWEFNPATVTIAAGDTVTWVNDDSTNHNIAFEITFDAAPTRATPIKVRKTKAYSLVFPETGTFHYVCKIHEDYDMKGTIVVK
ncbi:MAG: hypothetical protein HOC23_09540 [Halieaceae bacterium]|jgi:plastocyanin|nr:hypothetical protein [Halieaceae bacterium]